MANQHEEGAEMERIVKIRAGQPVGSRLLSAGYFEFESVQADELVKRASQECDVSESVKLLVHRPRALRSSMLRVNVVAVNSHSVYGAGGLDITTWKNNLWSGLSPRRLPLETPLRLVSARLRLDHPSAIWYVAECPGIFVCLPPKAEAAGRRVLDVREEFRPADSDIVVFGIW